MQSVTTSLVTGKLDSIPSKSDRGISFEICDYLKIRNKTTHSDPAGKSPAVYKPIDCELNYQAIGIALGIFGLIVTLIIIICISCLRNNLLIALPTELAKLENELKTYLAREIKNVEAIDPSQRSGPENNFLQAAKNFLAAKTVPGRRTSLNDLKRTISNEQSEFQNWHTANAKQHHYSDYGDIRLFKSDNRYETTFEELVLENDDDEQGRAERGEFIPNGDGYIPLMVRK